jgi:O-antigen ligase
MVRAHLVIPKHILLLRLARVIGVWFFALFLFAGYYKADPRLAFIQRHFDLTLLFLILSFLAALRRVLRKSFATKISAGFLKVAILFSLLATSLLGGLLISQSEGYGLDKAVRFIVLTGWAFFGTAFFITDLISLKHFSWALVTISTVMAIDAVLNYPGVGKIGFVSALGSNYIALARAGGLGLLTTLAFLLPTARRPFARLCLWAIAGLQLWAMLNAGARGPVLALALSLLVFFALSMRGFPRLKVDRFAWRLSIVALIVAVFVSIAGSELFSTLVFRTQVLMTKLGNSAAMRLSSYKEAIRLWGNSPIWGIGTGGFAMAVTGSVFVRGYPHNIILELGAENGFLGVLVFLVMVGIAFKKGLVCLHTGDKFVRTVSRYLLVVCCFAFLNAMMSGDINDNRILFTLTGLLVATDRFFNGKVQGGQT